MANNEIRHGASRREVLLGASALALAGTQGAGPAAAQGKQMVFWSQLAGSKKAAGDALEAAFKAAHPEIALNSSLYAEPSQLNEKILTAISGNTAPDLFIQHWDYTLNYGSGGKLIDLDKSLADIGAAKLDAGLLAYSHTTGPNISVPLYGTSRGIGFNRKLVAEAGLNPDMPPKNWEELRKWSKAMTKRNGSLLQVSGFNLFYNDLSAWELFVLFLQGAGGSILSSDLKSPTFAGPEGVKALTFLHELVHVDKVTDPGFGVGTGAGGDPFTQGRAGLIIAGNFNINNSLKAGIDFGVAPMPKINGGGFTSLVDPFCFAVPSVSKNQEQALAFIKFALSQAQQVQFCVASKNVPALKSAQQDPAIQSDPFLAKFVEFSTYAPDRAPAIAAYSQMSTIVARAVQETLYNRVSAEASLQSAATQVQSLLAKA